MLNKTNVKQANLQMMWLSSSYNSCLNFFLTERFVFLNGFVLFFLSLVFNIELVIPIWGQMNHHFNFLYIFFFMLIIVLKDKCDFNIHAYWFIFSSHIWKNSKEILFFLCRFISVSVWNPKQVKTSSVGKMILLAVL